MKKKRKDKRVVRPKKCVMEAPENVDESKIHSLQLVLGADFSRDKMVHFLACADGDVEKTLQMYFSNEFEEELDDGSNQCSDVEEGEPIFSTLSFPVDGEDSGSSDTFNVEWEESAMKIVDVLGDSISPKKARSYLRETGGDYERAVALYFSRKSVMQSDTDEDSATEDAPSTPKADETAYELHKAVENDDFARVETLLKCNQTNHTLVYASFLYQQNKHGETALDIAIRRQNLDIIKLLKAEGIQLTETEEEELSPDPRNGNLLRAAGIQRTTEGEEGLSLDPPSDAEMDMHTNAMAAANKWQKQAKENATAPHQMVPMEVERTYEDIPRCAAKCKARKCSQRERYLCALVVFASLLMLVIMLPLSFSYIEFDQYGFMISTYSRAVVSGDDPLLPGRYYNGLTREMVTFPKRSFMLFMNNTSARTTDGLQFQIDVVLQIKFKRETLRSIYRQYGNRQDHLSHILRTVCSAAANDVLSQYTGDIVLENRLLVVSKLEVEINQSVEALGFYVIRTYIHSLGIPDALGDRMIDVVGTQLEIVLAKEKQKLETIKAISDQQTAIIMANLKAHRDKKAAEVRTVVASIFKTQQAVQFSTNFTTNFIKSKQYVTVDLLHMHTKLFQSHRNLTVILAKEKNALAAAEARVPHRLQMAEYEGKIRNISADNFLAVSKQIKTSIAEGIKRQSSSSKSAWYEFKLNMKNLTSADAIILEWVDSLAIYDKNIVDIYIPTKVQP